MARVFAFGESLIDIIFKNNEPVSARVGGSMLNSSISLGRLGAEIYFVSDFGVDHAGNMIESFLMENGVRTEYTERFKNKNSPIALAFLNDSGDASYSFYKPDLPKGRLMSLKIDFQPDDILLFGSFFAVNESVREALLSFIVDAKKAGAIIVYDPNIRAPHKNEVEQIKPLVLENMNFADIVRGSDEDFHILFNTDSSGQAYDLVQDMGCRNLIYTGNKNNVELLTAALHLHFEVPSIKVVSTIGAGDNFNAGIVWSLLKNNITRKEMEHLPEKSWREVAGNGISFATDVCLHYDNYISKQFAREVLRNVGL